jgi:protein-tyrosine kinase
MEQLMYALDMPHDEAAGGRFRPLPIDGGDANKIDYHGIQSVPCSKAVLRQNRILSGHEPAQFREPFQLLRTQLLQRLKENQWTTLAVTSPRAGDGKTLTAINLAISMAREVAYTVVLVDANLRRPSLLEHLGLAERQGLSDYLTDVIPIEELLIKPYYLEDLVILPGGRAMENSAEMLNSPKMERLVSHLKASTDRCVIIFDVPPVLGTAETVSFSPQVDAALLVARNNASTRKDLAQAMDLLSATNIVGTVLNRSGRVSP